MKGHSKDNLWFYKRAKHWLFSKVIVGVIIAVVVTMFNLYLFFPNTISANSEQGLINRLYLLSHSTITAPYFAKLVTVSRLPKELNDFQMYVYKDNDGVSDTISKYDNWEQEHYHWIVSKMNGGLFVDFGANIGFWLSFAAQLPNTHAAVGFEPYKRNVEIASATIKFHSLQSHDWVDKIKLYPFGVSEESQKCVLYSDKQNQGDGHSWCAPVGDPIPTNNRWVKRGDISLKPVNDILFKELGSDLRIDILKVDVEGFEMKALAGAKKLFEEGVVENVMMECVRSALEEKGSSIDEVRNFIREYGFSVYIGEKLIEDLNDIQCFQETYLRLEKQK